MKDSIVQQCLDILKKEEVKNEIKMLLKPVINFIFHEINQYIYAIIIVVFLIFIMNLVIFFILISLLRNKSNPLKYF